MQGLVGKETGHTRTESEHAVGTALEEVGWGWAGSLQGHRQPSGLRRGRRISGVAAVIEWGRGAVGRVNGSIQTHVYTHSHPTVDSRGSWKQVACAPGEACMNKTGYSVALKEKRRYLLPSRQTLRERRQTTGREFDQTSQTWSSLRKATTVLYLTLSNRKQTGVCQGLGGKE